MTFPADPSPPEASTDLEGALTLSTQFSIASNRGEIPSTLEVPVPSPATCTFVVRRWGEVSEGEREAFRRFYACVGDRLEDLAQRAAGSAEIDLDDATWSEITRIGEVGIAERPSG